MNEAVANERLRRTTLKREAHLEAAGNGSRGNPTAQRWKCCSDRVEAGGEDVAILQRYLAGWETAALTEQQDRLKILAAKPGQPAALAALIRAGNAEAWTGNSEDQLKALPLVGRGNSPAAYYETVAAKLTRKTSRPIYLAAIAAMPLFPDKDTEAVQALHDLAEATAEDNLTVSFAAIQAMNRIQADRWPEGIERRTLKRLRIAATPDFKFAPAQFEVKAGSPVELTFFNPDNLYHNLVIVKPGALESVGTAADLMAAQKDGLEKHYVPDLDTVLHWTPQLVIGSARTHVLRFYAPEEPGDYPYACTFPGHWRVMNGVMSVVE